MLLDVLVQGCCFAETKAIVPECRLITSHEWALKASLDLVDLFADATPFEGWYRDLATCS